MTHMRMRGGRIIVRKYVMFLIICTRQRMDGNLAHFFEPHVSVAGEMKRSVCEEGRPLQFLHQLGEVSR